MPRKKKATVKTETDQYNVQYSAHDMPVLLSNITPDTAVVILPELNSYLIVGPEVKGLGTLDVMASDEHPYQDIVLMIYAHWQADEQNGGQWN